MKLILFILFSVSVSVYAQDDDLDKLPYNDTPVTATTPNYFIIGGGYTLGYYSLNVDAYNKLLKDNFGLEGFSSGMIMHGGVGYSGIPFISNFRLGVSSMGGNQVISNSIDDYNLEQSINIQFTGMNFDYGYILSNHLAILIGSKIGWGSLDVNIIKGNALIEWNDINSIIDPTSYNYNINKKFMYFTPSVSLEWAATNFLILRLMANYNLTFDNPFSSTEENEYILNNTSKISNISNDLNNNGFYFEFGVFLGLFNY